MVLLLHWLVVRPRGVQKTPVRAAPIAESSLCVHHFVRARPSARAARHSYIYVFVHHASLPVPRATSSSSSLTSFRVPSADERYKCAH